MGLESIRRRRYLDLILREGREEREKVLLQGEKDISLFFLRMSFMSFLSLGEGEIFLLAKA